MAVEVSMASPQKDPIKVPRGLDTPEFIERLAEDMRVKSGSDLPLSCFVQQVKMQLAGKARGDTPIFSPERAASLASASASADFYRSWAMPE